MSGLRYVAVAILASAVAGCGKKEEESEVVPPGFCKTEAECQPAADRQNAVDRLLAEHRNLPRPAQLGRVIGIRRR